MQPKDIRDLRPEELATTEAEVREELFRLRVRGATGQVDNKMRARLVRRDLARVLTIRREKAGL